MKKTWKIILISFLALLILIQFYRPKKNDKVVNPKHDIVFTADMPANVKKKIVNACYDCHSETTHYPLYSNIAPVSWMMATHIKEGKSKLNFSAWAGYDKKEQIKLLSDICDEVTSGEMPLKSYVFMHSKSVINDSEKEEICNWADQAAEQIMKSKE